jgi:flavin reductase (DIM6/NTAB) family NADH-FMN oxidoreductase RutF
LEFTPSSVGCVIAGGNFSFGSIRRSGECAINLPTKRLVDAVAGIGIAPAVHRQTQEIRADGRQGAAVEAAAGEWWRISDAG